MSSSLVSSGNTTPNRARKDTTSQHAARTEPPCRTKFFAEPAPETLDRFRGRLRLRPVFMLERVAQEIEVAVPIHATLGVGYRRFVRPVVLVLSAAVLVLVLVLETIAND